MPSSFSSTAHAPSLSTASPTEDALCASMGNTGRPTVSRNRLSASGPSASTDCATTWSDPVSITARRTSSGGAPVACASPSRATASSAPCRSSPVSRPNRNRCSSSVAAPINSPTRRVRSACDPAPHDIAERGQRGVDVLDRQPGLRGGLHRIAQHPPPDAETPLREASRQVGDHDRYVVGFRSPEELGEQRDLPRPRPGGRDLLGHLCEPGEQHAAIVHRAAARRTRVRAPADKPHFPWDSRRELALRGLSRPMGKAVPRCETGAEIS